MRYGYLWPLNKDMDVYKINIKNRSLVTLQSSPDYDAEATISADGKRIVFTSARDGISILCRHLRYFLLPLSLPVSSLCFSSIML